MIPDPAFDHDFWQWVMLVCLSIYNVAAVHLTIKTLSKFIDWAKAVNQILKDMGTRPPGGS